MPIYGKYLFAGTHLAGHDVRVEDRKDQSQDSSVKEAKVGLEDNAGGGRGGRCHQVDLVSNKLNFFRNSRRSFLMVIWNLPEAQ